MRLLVVGANGLLGSNVVRAGQRRGWDVCGTYHSMRPDFEIPLVQFDLQAYDEFEAILAEFEPDVVVNCAAMTDVDGCETDPETARVLNGDAPGALAAQCVSHDVQFVHVSTDYVFDGTARDPYPETADPNPVQVYGESKLAGERAVRETAPAALVARLSFVWGIHRSRNELTGFPAWVRGQLQDGDEVPLFTDQWLTPTRAGQAADVLLDLIDHDASGLVHVACTSCVTPYEFGEVIAEVGGYDAELLGAGSMDDVDRDATRPAHSCLDVSRVESTLERAQPTLQEDVDAVRETFESA
ncbi:dTDP-4-dehydrorhamnose reductase [Halorubrum sp. AJ67]|uniref:dTDP-4-dehydrorhamnose reductase n=1 Tax=Halorubrum sp. AJ67 TaxID=1173487 RepID=UPI0003DC3D99|nr:dTDP-4-dehydrorhamnose reductase [Halorubrum sp. AJ67]CDK39321.1 dTDP-4-dehydrorhamnose reductase [Halorubrum sp. AJ67]